MKRYRPLAFFAVALLLGLVTSVLVFSWLQNEKDRLMAAPIPLNKNVQVLVSNADLSLLGGERTLRKSTWIERLSSMIRTRWFLLIPLRFACWITSVSFIIKAVFLSSLTGVVR